MEGFIHMVDDLSLECLLHMYVDDTTLSEVVPISAPDESTMQQEVNSLVTWTQRNDMKINPEKTKELIIDFSRNNSDIPPLYMNDTTVERVKSAKLVGVHVQDDLKWTTHVEEICAKANRRVFILTHLRRAGATPDDLVKVYCTLIRPLLEYACPVWSTSIPSYLISSIESIQKRCLKIIHPFISYDESRTLLKLPTLEERREVLCKTFFKKIQSTNDKLHYLLPEKNTIAQQYNLRKTLTYNRSHVNTDRFENTFIRYSIRNNINRREMLDNKML